MEALLDYANEHDEDGDRYMMVTKAVLVVEALIAEQAKTVLLPIMVGAPRSWEAVGMVSVVLEDLKFSAVHGG